MIRLAALGLGFFLCVAGVGLITSPLLFERAFGLPATTGATAWHNVAGSRELALGLAVFMLALRNETRALTIALFATAVVPLGDAIVVLRAGGPVTALAPHVVGVPSVLALAWLSARRVSPK